MTLFDPSGQRMMSGKNAKLEVRKSDNGGTVISFGKDAIELSPEQTYEMIKALITCIGGRINERQVAPGLPGLTIPMK